MAKFYDLDQVQLIIGTVRISGYGEGDALTLERNSPIQERSIGADGGATYSRNNDKTWTATITCKETSLAYRLLSDLMQAQEALPSITPLPFAMTDANNGDSCTGQYSVFMESPSLSKAKAAGDRVFVIDIPDALVVFGALNLT